jgi:hypothetical protein
MPAIEIYTKRQRHNTLLASLRSERNSFTSHWREISELVRPRRSRFFTSDVNKGDKRNQKIIDATAALASRTCRAGMMAGITSPARPWMKLSVSDQNLMQVPAVKFWLDDVTRLMLDMYGRSNIYNVLPIVYGDMADFGTGAMLIEEDFENVIHCYSFPIGSYMIANDDKMRIRIFAREFRLTVRQLIMKFGKVKDDGQPDWSKFSEQVKNLWDRGQHDEWIDVVHIIEPNEDYDPKMLDSKYKKYSSCYYEASNSTTSNSSDKDENRYLRESGYNYFPVLAPRWETTDGDAYGTDCPGMTALGDIKQLMKQQKDKAQAIEKGHKPAMIAPVALRTSKASIIAGDITYVDEREGTKGFRRAHDIQLELQYLLQDIQAVQKIIGRAYYEDMFLMMSQSDRREITATEINEKAQEKMFMIGQMLEQANQDMLDPMTDISFDIMLSQNLIPEPPKELRGIKLKVEYTSVMAEAQKSVGLGALERFTTFTVGIAQQTGDPSHIMKVDFDEVIDEYATGSGVSPKVVRSKEVVAAMKEQAQKQAELQQALAAAKDISGERGSSTTSVIMEERVLVRNAGDKKQVKSAAQKEKFKREQELRDVAFVLSSEQGRRFIWRYLGLTGTDRQSFTGDVNWGLFNEGQRSIGALIKMDIIASDPMALIKMMTESKSREEKETEPEQQENSND